MRIALFTTASGNYIEFIPELLPSAKKYFFAADFVTFIVFTDRPDDLKYLYDKYPNKIIIHPVPPAKFPQASMLRCKHYANYMGNNPIAKDFDYCFAIDSDAIFVDYVGTSLKEESIGVKHCAYMFGGATFETNPQSACFIQNTKNATYYGGGFYGGEAFWFYFMNKQMNEYLEADQKNGIIPLWHDESALNKFFSVYPPSKSLSPEYHFPGWSQDNICNPYIKSIWDKNKVDYEPKIVFIEKTYKNKGVEYYRS